MKNKKIGLLNFHYSNQNFGAVLQASALAHEVEILGYEVEHIDFIPQYNFEIKRRFSGLRELIGDILRIIGVKKKIIKHNKISNSHIFEDFRFTWLKRSKNKFYDSKQLELYAEDLHAVIVGSDQVWRPDYTKEYALIYFLSFVSDNVKRVSYAASFGVDKWKQIEDKKFTAMVTQELSKFHAISVRELDGVNICRNVFNKPAENVLDPTLLVGREFFDSIIDSDMNNFKKLNSNIVYYKLDVDRHFLCFVKKLAKLNNFTLENIFYKKSKNGGMEYNSVSEWLYKLRSSELIITDSFHCICFAILFEKDFIYYPNVERGMSRIESLLNQLELTDRIFDKNIKFNFENVLEKRIDYSRVNKTLEIKRQLSRKFLQSAIN